jgi:predicted transcriptional regulator of viral defense system
MSVKSCRLLFSPDVEEPAATTIWDNSIIELEKHPVDRSGRDMADNLFRVAELQHGLFTAKQAKAAGYSEQAQHHNAKAGNWIREYRGIYRLVRYPQSEWANLMLWQLWSRNRLDAPLGVYSHETALSLYELSDVMPARLHMTVPHGFDRSAEIPSVLVLHRDALSAEEIGTMEGIRLTRPLRTIVDLISERILSPDLIEQAITQAVDRGFFTLDQLRSTQLTRRVSRLVRQFAPMVEA